MTATQPRITTYIVLMLLLGALPAQAWGQDTGRVVDEIRAAYQQLDYEAAVERARAALAEDDGLTLAARTEIHSILALIAYTRGDLDEARRHFNLALDLDPAHTLDPLLVSPKIVSFFDEVRAERRRSATETTGGPEIRYVVVRDNRPDAALRSMVLPGWGQLYKGERTKGWALAGLWGLNASAVVVAHLQAERSRNAYLDETNAAEVAARYDTYNSWHRARNSLLLGAAGIWLYSYVDALLSPGERPAQAYRPGPVSVLPSRTGLSLRLHF